MKKRLRFGEILLEMGVIAQSDLDKALARQKITKQPLGQIFEQLGIICDKDILRILARQFKMKKIEQIRRPVQFESLATKIDSRLAVERKIFPLGVKDGKLYLATCNPLDLATLDDIAFRTGQRTVPVLATPAEIDRAIRIFYLEEADPRGSAFRTILVVDDQETYSHTICSKLQQIGYRTLTADTGADALKLVLGKMPHLIILETALHGMSGKDVFRTLQTNCRSSQIPVIGMSTRAYAEEEALLLDMGFFDFVAKPLNFTRLLARVRRALTFCYDNAHAGVKSTSSIEWSEDKPGEDPLWGMATGS
jgi:CheY-like chemotaxis protein